MSKRESRPDESLKRKKEGQERRENELRQRVNKVGRNRLPLVKKLIASNVKIKAALCLLRGDRL